MKKLKWDTRANFALEYGFLAKELRPFWKYVQEVELMSLRITGSGSETDYEHHPKNPNAYGVYLRYTEEGQKKANLSPSEWIADFSNARAAASFKDLVTVLLTAHMDEQQKEDLAFKLMPEQDRAATK